MADQVTGLVLSGGGARGICHLGVMKALDEFGVKINYISATSAGSVTGCLFSYGYKPDEIMKMITSTSFAKSLKFAWSWTGLLKLDGLRDLLIKYIPENSFEALPIPVTIAATEIRKGSIQYFTTGELVPAILASCCVPAVFNPVEINGGMYVDGGVLDNLPVKGIDHKCNFIIGSHCNFIRSDVDLKNFRTVIERSLLMAINGNTTLSKSLCNILIEPPDVGRFSGFDVSKASEIYEIGYRYTKENFTAEQFHL
jgi:NTE family protein